jgi:hypothetical protein
MFQFSQILPAPATVALEKRSRPSSPFRPHTILPRRSRGPFFGLLIFATITFFFHHNYFSTTPTPEDDILIFLDGLPQPEGGSHPPRFYEWHDREKSLPQHDPDLPYPQGREGRYIRFSNQVAGTFSFSFLRSYCANASHNTDLADYRTKVSDGATLCKKSC